MKLECFFNRIYSISYGTETNTVSRLNLVRAGAVFCTGRQSVSTTKGTAEKVAENI